MVGVEERSSDLIFYKGELDHLVFLVGEELFCFQKMKQGFLRQSEIHFLTTESVFIIVIRPYTLVCKHEYI